MSLTIENNIFSDTLMRTQVSQAIASDMFTNAKAQNLEQAAIQFEALFLRSVLMQMRKANEALVDEDSLFNSKHERMMRDFYDDTLASTLASQKSTGIAQLIIKQLGQ